MVGPGQMPHVPKALSRPEGWPGGTGASKQGQENHVLSSILPNPGGPLEPVAIPTKKSDAKATGKSGVIQAVAR
jgi:hypothetical protein